MAATTNIRYARVEAEYQAMRKTQDALMDRIDTFEEAILGLSQAVHANHETTQRQIAELTQMLQAIIKHQNVPYEPMGFVKE